MDLAQPAISLADRIIGTLQTSAVVNADLIKTSMKFIEATKSSMDYKQLKEVVKTLEAMSFNANSIFRQTEFVLNDKSLQNIVEPDILKRIYKDSKMYLEIATEVNLYTRAVKLLLEEKQPSMFGNIEYTA